jgi:rhamnogalacturonyl hydrolase YesR
MRFFTLVFVAGRFSECISSVFVQPNGAEGRLSFMMAKSIVSRSQGTITGLGGSSEPLQAGLTQKAFRKYVNQYPDDASAQMIEDYIKSSVDSALPFLNNASKDTSYPLDRLSNGNNMIYLSQKEGNNTILNGASALRKSIDIQNRTAIEGLWYFVYPEWSYLDGMYSLAPFYALYTNTLDRGNSSAYADMFYQLNLLWRHCRHNDTGLLVHGYDYSKTAAWANPTTGASPYVWGRSLGWYMMALVDTLEILEPVKTSSKELTYQWKLWKSRFEDLSAAVVKSIDQASGAWWQILDQPGREGNYIESSGSAMFVYSLLRGSRLRYLPDYSNIANRAYEYIVDNFVIDNHNGTLSYNKTVAVCSLNSTASYEVSYLHPIIRKGNRS